MDCLQAQPLWPRIKSAFLFFIPAILYMIDNNIWYGVMSLINPSTYQLMSNIKIVFVAVLCRFALHKVPKMAP